MADIFISYASADRARAKAFADALAAHGWSVWWDRKIPPGRVFDEVIEEALDAAKCVVVLWSTASVGSSWARAEAAEAMRRKILVPVLIEHVKIPLEFRRLQAADLSQWQGSPSDPGFEQFSASIDAYVRRGGEPRSVPANATPEPAVTTRPALEPVADEKDRRPTPWLRSRTVLAAVGGVAMIVLLVAGYGVYKGMERRLTAEREAREQAERTASEAARVAAQREAEQQRRTAEEAAARARATWPAPRPQTDAPRLAAEPPPRAATPPSLDISGLWRDTTWGNMSQIVQQGETFQFDAWGSACRGNFRSSGTGLIRGRHVESTYRSTIPSEGRCSGTVSPDGTRMTSTCVDSVCGQFVSSAVSQ